jgi:ferredoxin-NADP reductase
MGTFAQIVGLTLGWLAIAWVALQGFALSLRSIQERIRTKRKLDRQRAHFRQRIESTARVARATKAIPDWHGWRPFRVVAAVDEARDVKSFYLSPVDGRPLAPFAPGQYLTFRLPIGDREQPAVRCYSLSDRPRQDYYRITVKRIAAARGRDDLAAGRGSSFLHERVQVGDVLEARAPAGTFIIDPLATEPIVLIGAGIGITPLVSMLEAIVHAGRQRTVYALFGFRNGEEHPFKEYLEKLAESHAQLQLHVSYSAPRGCDAQYRDFSHGGRITIERVREILPSNNFRFYVCGPGEMMETLVPSLWAWGVPESHVHFEAFGPASVRAGGAERALGRPAAPCEVRFARSGRTALWDGTFSSLLEFGEAAGVAMPSGCRAGSCGECLLGVRSGAVATIKRPSIPVPGRQCLACISVPQGELILDA